MKTQFMAPMKAKNSFNQAFGYKKKRKQKHHPPLSIRLTLDERAHLEKLAGNQSVSAYARKILLVRML